MLLKDLSLICAVIAFSSVASAATATTKAKAAAPAPSPSPSQAVPAPIIPLPPFNGTFANPYPPQFTIAATNTPLVAQWLKELNMTAVPNFPVVPFTAGGDPSNPKAIPADACDWTETNCINKDIIQCPKGVWGLTYDDGPTEFSEQLYNALDKTDQKATLFYIGSNVLQNWQAARRACGAGHQIAVHTWSHHPSTSLTNEQFVAEIKYTELAIKELCGFTPTYFRPPYGDIDNRIRGLLTQMGYTSVIWDLDTNDWMMAPGGQRTMAQVDQAFDQWIAAAPKDTTGHICLEHELYQNTVDAAIANLPRLQQTWKTMPVSACVNDPHPYKEHNITLATMNGAVAGVNNNPNSTTGTNTTGGSNTTVPTTAGKKNTAATLTTAGLSTLLAVVVMALSHL
ncbi:chitin deacetylase [Entomortierella parvispora]|uniref:Chitin deacetylase n=1 Tax=Entomortierella parvispora TaxID=205924 RepID=A0A9P3LRM6_9FUNG|nr:chitin deacetylase [Entomortierella parvispora]